MNDDEVRTGQGLIDIECLPVVPQYLQPRIERPDLCEWFFSAIFQKIANAPRMSIFEKADLMTPGNQF